MRGRSGGDVEECTFPAPRPSFLPPSLPLPRPHLRVDQGGVIQGLLFLSPRTPVERFHVPIVQVEGLVHKEEGRREGGREEVRE